MSETAGSRKFDPLPSHVAIVPDGNGRWAQNRGLPRLSGHAAGIDNMHRMVNYLSEYPIRYLTIYGFSTENWKRPESEVNGLFDMLVDFIDKVAPEIHKKGIRLRHLGRLSELPANLQSSLTQAVELTRHNSGITLSIAFNYGARTEILDAARRMIEGGVPVEKISEKTFSRYLYTAGMPDVDLLIRTGDVMRQSNFLLWQTTYSEFHFTKVLWPNFGKKDIDRALLSYSRRHRRFGGL